jgi:hypothetical protein
MPTTKITWETPPETTTAFTAADPDAYKDLIKALRSHPGDWAVADEFTGDKAASQAYRLAKTIRDGKKGFTGPNVKFEARTHKTSKTTTKVYARAVPAALTAVPDAAAAADASMLDSVGAAAEPQPAAAK